MTKKTISIWFLLLLVMFACSSLPGQFEAEPVSLETVNLEKLEIYVQDQPIFVDMDELLVVIDDPQILDSWNEMLGNCQTHRPNHPRYTDHFLVVAYHENGHLLYELTVDSADGNEVDMSPIRTEKELDFSTTYELGLYRCEGLREIVDEITSK